MSKKAKKYNIDSFEKLVNVANPKNIERLSIDLLMWLNYTVATIQNIRDQHPEETKSRSNWEVMKSTFRWIDDGKNDIKEIILSNTKTGEETTIKI